MENETIITLTADIVSAHVSNNSLASNELPMVIQSVYGALAGLGQPQPVEEAPREPAVSVRSSVKHDTITCLECGQKMKILKRHLSTEHNLSPTEYKARWNLPADYPFVTPEYAARRKELALKIGLGRGVTKKRGRKPKAAN